jgi:hypothetical protein
MRQGPAWAEPYSHRRIDRNAPTIIALEPERATDAAACCNTGRSRTCRRSRSWTSPARSHTWGSNSRMGHRTHPPMLIGPQLSAGARSGRMHGMSGGAGGESALLRPCQARSSRERGRYVPQCSSSAIRATRQPRHETVSIRDNGQATAVAPRSARRPSRARRPAAQAEAQTRVARLTRRDYASD